MSENVHIFTAHNISEGEREKLASSFELMGFDPSCVTRVEITTIPDSECNHNQPTGEKT